MRVIVDSFSVNNYSGLKMSCLTAAQRAKILARIALKESQLEIANDTYTTLLGEPQEQYRFDSNEGAQSERSRKLQDLKDQIDSLQSEIDQLYRKLQCGGLVNLRLRRYA